jgi:recombination associated protein RdgC
MDMETQGWVSPLGRDSESLVHAVHKCFMIATRKEEKILPATVVREFVNEKVEEIETQQLRKVRKREKDEIREEILQELIPRAFTRSTYQYAYLDAQHGWLLIDTASRKKAEEMVSFLRKSLGSLPVTLPTLQDSPAHVMTQWLNEPANCPSDFQLADACELMDTSIEGAVVNCKRQDLLAEEIHAHLEAGKLVTRLALKWNERLGLVVDDELVIRRLQFLDLIQEQAQEATTESRAQRFDADFAIMTGELAAVIKRLIEVFGGEDEKAYEKMK